MDSNLNHWTVHAYEHGYGCGHHRTLKAVLLHPFRLCYRCVGVYYDYLVELNVNQSQLHGTFHMLCSHQMTPSLGPLAVIIVDFLGASVEGCACE